jgi:hypothetical protein
MHSIAEKRSAKANSNKQGKCKATRRHHLSKADIRKRDAGVLGGSGLGELVSEGSSRFPSKMIGYDCKIAPDEAATGGDYGQETFKTRQGPDRR